jgi:hypothetical protein
MKGIGSTIDTPSPRQAGDRRSTAGSPRTGVRGCPPQVARGVGLLFEKV